MSDLFYLFSNNIFPIFIAAAAGFLVARYLGVSARAVSRIAFYIFSPCLVFVLLTNGQLDGDDITNMAAFAAVNILLMGLITAMISRFLRLERSLMVALIITVMFANAGNYGLSLTLFAYGEDAVAHASIYFVTSAFLVYTLGVVLASWGRSNLKTALMGVFKVPVIYAVIFALIYNWLDWQLPLPIGRTVNLFSEAAIPVMIVLLGIQLYNAKISRDFFNVGLSNALRLLASPVLAVAIAGLFNLTGAAYQAGVIESAVPTAVLTTVLATEYDLDAAFVTTTVVTSTLLSPLTLTPLLAFLGA